MPFGEQNLCTFQSKTPGIKLQAANTLFEKTPLPCHEAYSAGARSALMLMRTSCIHIFAFLARPGALGSPSTKKNSWNKFLIKGNRVIKNDIGRDWDTYDHSLQLHYRQFLVAHVFDDLPSLYPFISCLYL